MIYLEKEKGLIFNRDFKQAFNTGFNNVVNGLIEDIGSDDKTGYGRRNLYAARTISSFAQAGPISKPVIKKKLRSKVSGLLENLAQGPVSDNYGWRSNLISALTSLIEAGLIYKKDMNKKAGKRVLYEYIIRGLNPSGGLDQHLPRLLEVLLKSKIVARDELKKAVNNGWGESAVQWEKVRDALVYKPVSYLSQSRTEAFKILLEKGIIDKREEKSLLQFFTDIALRLPPEDKACFSAAELSAFFIEEKMTDLWKIKNGLDIESLRIAGALDYFEKIFLSINKDKAEREKGLRADKKRELFSIYAKTLPGLREIFLKNNPEEARALAGLKALSVFVKFIKQRIYGSAFPLAKGGDEQIAKNLIKDLFRPLFDGEEGIYERLAKDEEDILKMLLEEDSLIDIYALYALVNTVFRDPYLIKSFGKVSYGAGINLKLKAYQMLYKQQRPPDEVIAYIKKRLRELREKEKRLKKEITIGGEVEIWRCIMNYPKKSGEFLSHLAGMNLDNLDQLSLIEFSPQPARDWEDLAELLDTMKFIGMIPVRENEAFSFHIMIGNPKGTKIESPSFEEGVALITFAEAFLTCSDERLMQEMDTDGLYYLDSVHEHHSEVREVTPGEGIETGVLTHYTPGNILADRRLEFDKDPLNSNHRRALRMVYYLHTALLSYVKESNIRGEMDTILAELYNEFRMEFKEFINKNRLNKFFKSGKSHISGEDSLWYIYKVRTPRLRKALQGIVEKHVARIEQARNRAVEAVKSSSAGRAEEIDNILSDCRTNIKLAYLMMAETLKKAGYDMPDSDTDPDAVMGREIEEIDLRDFTAGPDGKRLFAGAFLDAVPGIEIAGMAARERDITVNLLYFVPDKNLYKNGRSLFARYALFIDSKKRLRMGRFKRPQPIHAFITGARVKAKGVKDFFHDSNIMLLNSDHVKDFTVDKMGFYRFLKRCSLRTPRSILIKRGAAINEIRKRLKDFVRGKDVNGFVVKPRSGMSGLFIGMYDKGEIDTAMSLVTKILDNGYDVVIQKRIISKEYYIDGKRIDFNIRGFTTWRNAKVAADPDMFEVRYREFGREPVNYEKGAKILSLDEFFQKTGLTLQEQREFVKGITGLFKPAAKRLFMELKRRNPDLDPMKLKPGLIGWDAIPDEKGRWHIIEANSGQVGGMQSLEKIYSRSDKGRRGNAVAPLVGYLKELADKGRQRIPEEVLNNRKVEAELDVLEETDLLFALGYAYRFIDDRKAAAIFNRVADLLLESGIGLNETEAETWYNLGLTLFDLGDYRGSEKALRFTVKLAPDVKEFWFDLGDALYFKKKYKEAAWALRKALKIDPEYKEAGKLLKKTSSRLKAKTKSSSAGSRPGALLEQKLYLAIASAA